MWEPNQNQTDHKFHKGLSDSYASFFSPENNKYDWHIFPAIVTRWQDEDVTQTVSVCINFDNYTEEEHE